MSAKPLFIIGKAKLVHINARKEGPEDDKILATDLKFLLTTSSEFLIYFHSQLRLMLFTRDGDPRFPLMGPVDWDYEFANMKLDLEPTALDPQIHFNGVKLKKWSFKPKKGFQVDVCFSAQVKPDRQEFGIIGRALIAEEVALRIFSENGDLFEGEPTAGQQAARAAAATRNEEEPQLPGLEPAPSSANPEPPPAGKPDAPLELTPELLAKMREAGIAEAKKFDDERDFDSGLAAALRALDVPRSFLEEHLGALQTSFTDGFEEELARAE